MKRTEIQLSRQNEDGSRPTFVFEWVTTAMQMELWDIWGQDVGDLSQLSADRKLTAEVCEWLKRHLRDWRNVQDGDGQTVPFDPDAITMVTQAPDIWFMAGRLSSYADPDPDEKKDSASE